MGLGRNALLAAFVLTGLSSMAVSQAAFAQAPDTGAVQVADSELAITMRVDGELTFDTQGNVISHKVTTPDLKQGIIDLADKEMAQMKFKPVVIDGRPVNARTFVRMTLVARGLDEGKYEVSIEKSLFFDGSFGADGIPNRKPRTEADRQYARDNWTVAKRKRMPGYPMGLMRAGVDGAVAIRLLMRPDGTVENAFVTQSALFNIKGRDKTLDKARGLFERMALDAIRTWTFNPPEKSGAVDDPEWRSGDIMVQFTVRDDAMNKPGVWRLEQRGVRKVAEWEARRDQRLLVGVSVMTGDEDVMSPDPRIRLAN